MRFESHNSLISPFSQPNKKKKTSLSLSHTHGHTHFNFYSDKSFIISAILIPQKKGASLILQSFIQSHVQWKMSNKRSKSKQGFQLWHLSDTTQTYTQLHTRESVKWGWTGRGLHFIKFSVMNIRYLEMLRERWATDCEGNMQEWSVVTGICNKSD